MMTDHETSWTVPGPDRVGHSPTDSDIQSHRFSLYICEVAVHRKSVQQTPALKSHAVRLCFCMPARE